MRADRPLILAVLLLAAGLGLIFGYCHGNASLSVNYPFAGSVVKLNIQTYGPAAVSGPVLTLLGLIALVWAFLCAVFTQFGFGGNRGKDEDDGAPTRLLE
ncbi:MAG TPA: hypothetical protein VG844_12830 [Terracidiphilus sp.]|jgi:hypothetical protein|nr:hypothetical protein [Terracidiphilus sp.]